MKILYKNMVEMVYCPPTPETIIARAARVCYRSEMDGKRSDSELVRHLIHRGHLSVLECVSASFLITCDRGTSHQIVRHRTGKYAQESTRFCNYSEGKFDSEITVICPYNLKDSYQDVFDTWESSCLRSEEAYLSLIGQGASPQDARSVLPTCLATRLHMTMDFRNLRNFIKNGLQVNLRKRSDMLLW